MMVNTDLSYAEDVPNTIINDREKKVDEWMIEKVKCFRTQT